MSAAISVPGVPGAFIREVDELPDALEGGVRVGPYSIARPGALLRVVPGLGRFLALEGREIQVAREPGASAVEIDQFLYGAVRGALVLQRGGFPLHASALVPPGADFAIAIAGPSGAGKSTLAAELVRRGWSLLGDDLTAVYRDRDEIVAWPGRPGIKLWNDACFRMGQDPADLQAIPGDRDKYVLPVRTIDQPVRLQAITELDRSRGGGMKPVRGPERVSFLMENTFRPKYLAALGCVEAHFRLSCYMSEQVELSRLHHAGSVEEGADAIQNHVGATMRLSSLAAGSI